MKTARFPASLLGKLERHQWAGLGGSVLLHLAILLGWRQAPAPEVQPVSFEIALEAPKPEPRVQAKNQTKLREVKAKAKNRKPLAKKKKSPPREAHTLDAEFRKETLKPKNAPALDLPDTRDLAMPALADKASTSKPDQDAQAGKSTQVAQAVAVTVPTAPASAGPAPQQLPNPQPAQFAAADNPQAAAPTLLAAHPGESVAPLQEPGIALASSTSLAASGAADNAGQGPGSLSASQGNGAGLNVAAGAGAQSSNSREAPPLAGGEPQGIRLSASGSLSERANLPAGAGALPAGPVAVDTGRAASIPAQGSGSALASAQAGGASASPRTEQARGSTGASTTTPAAAGTEAPGRLAASGTGKPTPTALRPPKGKDGGKESNKLSGSAASASTGRGDPGAGASLAASNGRPGQAGASSQRLVLRSAGSGPGLSQSGKSLALAPGEPGSSPGLAVTLQTLVATPATRSGRGQGGSGQAALAAQGSGSGGGYPGTSLARTGSPAGTATAPTRLALAGTGNGIGVAPGGGRTVRDGHGSLSGALPAQAGAAGPEAGPQAGGLQPLKTPDQQIARLDSQVKPLDVLAPSTFCPLPLPGHSFPDNRPPKADGGNGNQPAYAQDNPSFTFPLQALLGNIQGKVTVRVEVKPDGKPGRMWLKQSSGSGILDRDALSQLTLWQFVPARREGQPVTAWIDVPVIYRLQDNKK